MWWKPTYLILILVSTIIDFICAQQIEKTQRFKKLFLWISVGFNLGILFSFKCLDFFIQSIFDAYNIFAAAPVTSPVLNIVLPVGISFYTFQTMSYTIDVYKGKQRATYNLSDFALDVSFFPQLVAGPIERSTHLLPQLKNYRFRFDEIAFKSGLYLMTWGFFKKVVIGDNLATVVDLIYNSPQDHSGLVLLMGTYFFTFQIYCNFSGYSDIAIGAARLLGIDLMKNFNRPYAAQNISDFWKRWHISLSTWFRDYFYIPLGGNRGTKYKWLRNLFLTFLISGLWHGVPY